MVTSHKEIRQMIRTGKETIKTRFQKRWRQESFLWILWEEEGNISPQKIVQHEEKDVESVERRTTLQRFANKKHQLNCINYSTQKSHLLMSQHTLSKEEITKVETKKEAMGGAYTDEEKNSKSIVECQIDGGAS